MALVVEHKEHSLDEDLGVLLSHEGGEVLVVEEVLAVFLKYFVDFYAV
jgi:hypothetical protein